MGHCTFQDVLNLVKAVKDMKIKGKVDKTNLDCETYINGKFTQSRNRQADAKQKQLLN